jgi:retinol-binding protein 3
MSRKAMMLTFFYFAFAISVAIGQQTNETFQMTPELRQAIIQDIPKLLDESYIYPDVAKKMGELIVKRFQEGAYNSLSDPKEFCKAVTVDMRSVSNDKHLSFAYAPEEVEQTRKLKGQDENQKKEAEAKYLATIQEDNFGFRKVERLNGNVGYVSLHFFHSADIAGPTAIAAMNFLSYTDAVIIDLRDNGGGDPTQIQLILSYFFKEPTHLNDLYYRRDNLTENYWTLPYVPGHMMPDVDLYVLTSSYTFSGAEEFAYNLKNLKRATIVGEVTGGGAHPVDSQIVQDRFILRIPYGRAINPITKTNWEGTGIKPDVEVRASEALDKAYQMALEKLASKAKTPEEKQEITWTLDGLAASAKHVTLNESAMKALAGVYEERKITLEDGQLYYQRTGPKFRLIPLSSTLFGLEGFDDFRVEFVIQNNQAIEIIGRYSDGTKDSTKRTQ